MTRINRLGIVLMFSALRWQSVALHSETFNPEIAGTIAGICVIIGVFCLFMDGDLMVFVMSVLRIC